MNPVPRENDDETQKAIDEYLAKGGKITYCPPGQRSEDIDIKGGYYKRKKKTTEAKE